MKSGVGWERTTRQKTIGELLLLPGSVNMESPAEPGLFMQASVFANQPASSS
jgi:hypothetical protein